MNHWLDRIQICQGGFIGITDDLINFWDEYMWNKMAHDRQIKQNRHGGGGWGFVVDFFVIFKLLYPKI